MKKRLGFIGVMIVTIGVLTACGGETRVNYSSPEEALGEYMETVKEGRIEESKDFIHGVVVESYSDHEDRTLDIDKDTIERVKETEGYKDYEREIEIVFSEIDYKITDTYEIEPEGDKEFSIELTLKDLYESNEHVKHAMEEEYTERFNSQEDETSVLESVNEMYGEQARNIRESEPVTMPGYIGIYKSEKKEKGLKKNWMISTMDYELFSLLTEDYNLEGK